jgi:hypothetical protein
MSSTADGIAGERFPIAPVASQSNFVSVADSLHQLRTPPVNFTVIALDGAGGLA